MESMNGNIVVISILAANLLATLVGFSVLIGKIQEASRWKGWADTTIRSNEKRLTVHGDRIDDMRVQQAKHEGHS